jgi:DNA-binding CsgD family transcriptional regulator
VATELYVSIKTVEFHLRHIYEKLGVTSRVLLAERVRGRRGEN